MSLTAKELAVLTAIDNSEYGDQLGDSVWTFTITDNSDLEPRAIPGIIASLLKKGLVITGGSSRANDDDYNIAMTDAGIAAYLAVVGKSRKSTPASEKASYDLARVQQAALDAKAKHPTQCKIHSTGFCTCRWNKRS